MLAQREQDAKQLLAYLSAHFPVLEFKNELDHVVCERVFHKDPGLPGDTEHQTLLLRFVRSIYALLHDAAPVFVAGHWDNILFKMSVDELLILGRPGVEYLLNHMVAVDVMGKLDEVLDEVFAELNHVLFLFEDLNDLLD